MAGELNHERPYLRRPASATTLSPHTGSTFESEDGYLDEPVFRQHQLLALLCPAQQ